MDVRTRLGEPGRRRLFGKGMAGKTDGGSAMIAVICVIMVTAVLSLSLLRAASALLISGRHAWADEQCRIMAESAARQIDGELTDKLYGKPPGGFAEDESLWGYAGAFAGKEGEKRVFRLDRGHSENWPEEAGILTLSLLCLGSGAGEDTDFRDRDLELHVEITCANTEGTYTLTNIYHKVNGEEEGTWKWSGLVERE